VLNGRVGSLLEVGTGFHPELTGRENIYLSGAILGMTRKEIARNFDEIVAFSEVEKFIDTPVKRYSSGMSVRLGFAIAAHLEPEILLIDEVLAVGDANFQRKSLGKMDDVSHSGRTVLFVSHNMAMVRKICSRAVLIEGGRLVSEGNTGDIVEQYAQISRGGSNEIGKQRINKWVLANQESEAINVRDVELLMPDGSPLGQREVEGGLTIRVHYTASQRIVAPGFIIMIRTRDGVLLSKVSTEPISGYHIAEVRGDGTVEVTFRDLQLTGGRYYISFEISQANTEWLLKLPDIAWFDMAARDVYGSGMALDNRRGYIFAHHRWDHQVGRKQWPATIAAASTQDRGPDSTRAVEGATSDAGDTARTL
jgi:lipopolysaccharide transport system ATP-binding protein